MRKGTYFCIDAHTCGNPVRLVTSGHPPLKGTTMSEKRHYFLTHYDWIRTGLMFEPRGHDMMSGAFLYPPCSENADASILFIETSGCLPMCGHGTIGTVTAAIQAGLLVPKQKGELVLDVPAGQIHVVYEENKGLVEWVKIYNVPSFLAYQNVHIEVPDLGYLTVDIAYGGNFYVIVEPQKHFPGIDKWSSHEILRYSPIIRKLVNLKHKCVHPLDPSVNGASHILWTGHPTHAGSSAGNAVFYGDRAIDRSPCGTGTSARMAQLYARGQLSVGETFVHESYIGSQFTGCIEGVTLIGDKPAILPSIKGWAKVFGQNTITIDDDDPYAHGFQIK